VHHADFERPHAFSIGGLEADRQESSSFHGISQNQPEPVIGDVLHACEDHRAFRRKADGPAKAPQCTGIADRFAPVLTTPVKRLGHKRRLPCARPPVPDGHWNRPPGRTIHARVETVSNLLANRGKSNKKLAAFPKNLPNDVSPQRGPCDAAG